MSDPKFKIYGRARLDDRQVDELIGVIRGLIADRRLNDEEIGFLHKWLVANIHLTDNPIVNTLMVRINEIVADGIIDADEREELMSTLNAFSGNNFGLGEEMKSTTLPLDDPAPNVAFAGNNFVLTGTFTFGCRNECEAEIKNRSGRVTPLNQQTDFLVVGSYVSETWSHSAYGQKIEKAVKIRDKLGRLAIVSEVTWFDALEL